jgi:hypothetical protein
MTLSCTFCYTLFSSKQRLQYHIDNKVCIKDDYTCFFCYKKYKTKEKIMNHLNLIHSEKKSNDKEEKPIDIINIINNNIYKLINMKNLPNNLFNKIHSINNELNNILINNNCLVCVFCNKTFSRKDVLIRHQEKYCNKI